MKRSKVVFVCSPKEEDQVSDFFYPEVHPRIISFDDPVTYEGWKDDDFLLAIICDPSGEAGGLRKVEEFRASFPDLPVFLITGHPSSEYLLKAIKLQVSNVFVQPVKKEEFKAAVLQMLEEREYAEAPVSAQGRRPTSLRHLWRSVIGWVPGFSGKPASANSTAILGIAPSGSLPFFNKKLEQENSFDISLRFFGTFGMKIRGKAIPRIKGKKNASLLAYLLFHHDRSIHREILMNTFWSDFSPASARNSLNVAICSIRKSLSKTFNDQEIILYENESYCINPEMAIISDVEKFIYFWKKGKDIEASQGLTNALGAYNKAVGLYREEFLADLRFEDWCESERDNLKEIYLFILSKLSAYFYQEKQFDACISIGKKMLSKDNCLEDVHRKLMKCYYALGLGDLALKQYFKCKKALEEEFDLQPSEPTERLFHKIHRGLAL